MTYLAHSKEIAVTLQITVRGVDIFQDVECDAIDGEAEWKITGFQFSSNDQTITIGKEDGLFNILLGGGDNDYIDEQLASCFSFQRDEDSGYVTRATVIA